MRLSARRRRARRRRQPPAGCCHPVRTRASSRRGRDAPVTRDEREPRPTLVAAPLRAAPRASHATKRGGAAASAAACGQRRPRPGGPAARAPSALDGRGRPVAGRARAPHRDEEDAPRAGRRRRARARARRGRAAGRPRRQLLRRAWPRAAAEVEAAAASAHARHVRRGLRARESDGASPPDLFCSAVEMAAFRRLPRVPTPAERTTANDGMLSRSTPEQKSNVKVSGVHWLISTQVDPVTKVALPGARHRRRPTAVPARQYADAGTSGGERLRGQRAQRPLAGRSARTTTCTGARRRRRRRTCRGCRRGVRAPAPAASSSKAADHFIPALSPLTTRVLYGGRKILVSADPAWPVHRGECSLEGHVKRHGHVVVFLSARARAGVEQQSPASYHLRPQGRGSRE